MSARDAEGVTAASSFNCSLILFKQGVGQVKGADFLAVSLSEICFQDKLLKWWRTDATKSSHFLILSLLLLFFKAGARDFTSCKPEQPSSGPMQARWLQQTGAVPTLLLLPHPSLDSLAAVQAQLPGSRLLNQEQVAANYICAAASFCSLSSQCHPPLPARKNPLQHSSLPPGSNAYATAQGGGKKWHWCGPSPSKAPSTGTCLKSPGLSWTGAGRVGRKSSSSTGTPENCPALAQFFAA